VFGIMCLTTVLAIQFHKFFLDGFFLFLTYLATSHLT